MPNPSLSDLLKSSKKSGRNLAEALSEPTPDPLAGVEYTGSVEVDAAAELDALQSAFRSRRTAEDKRFRDATDSEYWFAVCFESRAEKEAFLRAAKLFQLGDKYLDGAKVAAVLGLKGDSHA